jgi:hypothetical protein
LSVNTEKNKNNSNESAYGNYGVEGESRNAEYA